MTNGTDRYLMAARSLRSSPTALRTSPALRSLLRSLWTSLLPSLWPQMMRRLSRPILALALLLLLATQAFAQELVAVPPLQSRVTDLAGMLSPDQRTRLENILREQEERTGNQIAILLVNSTAPEAIEQYGIRVADAWKLGRKGIDDGVILLVAKDNPDALRRLRIETGRGVQGSLTDAQSGRILRDVIAPHFRQNDFYGGLSAGVAAIAATVAKEQLPANQRATAGATMDGGVAWLPFLIFAFVMLTAIRRGARGRNRFNSGGWGRSGGVILGTGLGYGMGRGHGGWGGSGGGWGGSGGGGFSGGGGGFDGGGASGNW